MPVQIQMRRGTAAQWTTADPVLAAGEIGLETDTGKQKTGDGTTAWTSLAYATMAPSAHASDHTDGTDDIQSATSGQKGLATAAQITKLDAIEALADVTDATNVNAAGAVMESDYNAQTVLVAASDNTPLPVTVAASSFVGRKSTGDVGAMTAAESRTVLNVEDGSTADQTAGEIEAIVSHDNLVDFVAGEHRIINDGGTSATELWSASKIDGVTAPIADTTALVKGSADATKLVRMEVDGLTTATTRVITVPDQDLTLIDTADSRLSDERSADAIATTGADVNVDAAAPPTTGQILKATSATTATWQNEAAAGGDTFIVSTSLGDKTGPGISTTSATYSTVGMLCVAGSVANSGSAVCRQTGGCTGQVRLYNLTAANVAFESAAFSSTSWTDTSLGSVVNAPSQGDVIEIQLKRATGSGGDTAEIAFTSLIMDA